MACEGPCEGVRWSYGHWSDCNVTCGGGRQQRHAVCVDVDGKSLSDEKCVALEAVTSRECGTETCPEWKTGDWTSVSDKLRLYFHKAFFN